jgi:DUF1365 family protein
MTARHSCIYEGWVRHRRTAPVTNRFRYRLFMMYLDLDELPSLFSGRWLWSTRRPAVARFRRADHLGAPETPLADAVRDLVETASGRRPAGPIRLLTNLRYFGFGMNPVSFFYCFDETGARVETIVAEVNNTPWGERHCYVLTPDMEQGPRAAKVYRFDKDFHVSPFMGMKQVYEWRFSDPTATLPVHMINFEDGRRLFDATMVLNRTEMTGRALARVLVQYPLLTVKVFVGIYYQALKLRLKRCPFHPHPKHSLQPEGVSP